VTGLDTLITHGGHPDIANIAVRRPGRLTGSNAPSRARDGCIDLAAALAETTCDVRTGGVRHDPFVSPSHARANRLT